MNERIRELLLQATTLRGPPFIRFKVDQEKFAELIVRECLDQLLVSDPTEDFDKGIAWSAKQINDHFRS
jgi:hypothetical protein